MSVLHPAILAGLGLTAIPVVLHLLMRARPKQLDFPALRLLENVRRQSVQRLRLRHLALLLLRMLLIALFVLAVARPTLPAANYGLTTFEWGALLAVLAVAGGAYAAGRYYWQSKAKSIHEQRLRETYLRYGSIVAAIILALLAVGLPYQRRVAAELSGPALPAQLNVPVASVLIFDLSASMSYQQENITRTEAARKLALSQVEGLPRESKVAIADNHHLRPIRFLKSVSTAETRLAKTDSMRPQDVTSSLNDVVLGAIRAQEEDREKVMAESGGGTDDRYLREIFVYTDRLRSAWRLEDAERLREELARTDWLQVYLIDVGANDPSNVSIRNLSLSDERAIRGIPTRLQADIVNQTENAGQFLVELYVEDESGSLAKRDQKLVAVEPDQIEQVTMPVAIDRAGVVQGELRLASIDALPADNVSSFTIDSIPRRRLWVVSDRLSETFVWQQALAPQGVVEKGMHRYEVEEFIPTELVRALDNTSKSEWPDVIYLVNVERMTETGWEHLQNYVASGGGLGIILGTTKIERDSYLSQEWLPGKLDVHTRAREKVSMTIRLPDHPIFEYLNQLDALGIISSAPVHRFWKVNPDLDSRIVSAYTDSDQSPAILTRQWDRGRVAMVTTAVDLTGASEHRNWSELARFGWVYAAWGDHLTRYLSGLEAGALNRIAGSPVFLELNAGIPHQEALFRQPGLRQTRIDVPYRSTGFVVSIAHDDSPIEDTATDDSTSHLLDMSGNYQLIVSEPEQTAFGFSLQLPIHETDMATLNETELDELFGEGRWLLSRNISELEHSVLLSRIGVEAYPLIMSLLVLFFLAEHVVANIFYRKEGT